MVRTLCALVLAGAFAATAVAATVRPVKVTVRGYPLVCGRPTGLLHVVLPATVGVPRAIPATAVTVNGIVASKVSVDGHTVSVTIPRRPGMTCLSIVLGRLTITFAPRAHVAMHGARTAKVVHLPRTYAATVSG